MPLNKSFGSGEGVEPYKKLLHLTDPTLTLSEIGENITAQYKKLYPTEKLLRVVRLQDSDQSDLDPDYTVEDVFKLGDQCRALVTLESPEPDRNASVNSNISKIDNAIASEYAPSAPVLASENNENYFQSKSSQIPQKSPRPRSPVDDSPYIAPQRLPKLSPPQETVNRDVPTKQVTAILTHRVTLGMLNVPTQNNVEKVIVENDEEVPEVRRVIPDEDLSSVAQIDDDDAASVSVEQLTRESDLLKPTEVMDKDEGVNLFKKHILKFCQQSKKVDSPIPKSLNIDMVDSPHKGDVRGTRLSRRTISHSNEEQKNNTKNVANSARKLSGDNVSKRDAKSLAAPTKSQPQPHGLKSQQQALKAQLLTLKSQQQAPKTQLQMLKSQLQLAKNQPQALNSDLDIAKKLLALSRQFNYFELRLDKYKITQDTKAPVFNSLDVQALDRMDYHYDDGSGLLEATVRLCPREEPAKVKSSRDHTKRQGSSTEQSKEDEKRSQHFFECPESSPGGGVAGIKGPLSGANSSSGSSTTPTTGVQEAVGNVAKVNQSQPPGSQNFEQVSRPVSNSSFQGNPLPSVSTGSAKAAFLTNFSVGKASEIMDKEPWTKLGGSSKLQTKVKHSLQEGKNHKALGLSSSHAVNKALASLSSPDIEVIEMRTVGDSVTPNLATAANTSKGIEPHISKTSDGSHASHSLGASHSSANSDQALLTKPQASLDSLLATNDSNLNRHNATAINLLSNFAQQKRHPVSLGSPPAPTKDYEELKKRGDEIHKSLLGELQRPETAFKQASSRLTPTRIEANNKNPTANGRTNSTRHETSDSESSDSSESEDNLTSRKARLVAKHPKPASRAQSAVSSPLGTNSLVIPKRNATGHQFSTPQPKQSKDLPAAVNFHKEAVTEPLSKIRKIEGRLLSRLSSLKDLRTPLTQKTKATASDFRKEGTSVSIGGTPKSKQAPKKKANPFSGLESLDDDSSDSDNNTLKLDPKFLTVLLAMNRKRSYGRLDTK